MGLFDFFKKDKVIKDLSVQVKALQAFNQGNLYKDIVANFNRNIAIYPKQDINGYSERYATTDDVYSIIRMLATTSTLIPIYAYHIKDEEQQKKLSRIRQPHTKPYETKRYQIKALEDLPDNDRVEILMERPCENMSRFEFYEAIYSFLYSAGEAFIYKERAEFGVNAGLPTQLHVLYPQNIIIKVTDTLPRKIVAYDYKVNGQTIYENIPVEDIIYIKYFNPQMDFNGVELRGLSPLAVLAKRLARMDANIDTSVAQVQNAGVKKIVFDKSLVGTDGKQAVEILGQVKDNFYRFLKHPGNTGAPYFAGGEMGSIDIGSTLLELGIPELGKIDFKKLCNAYGTSDILFNSDAASTESNVMVMEKRTYTNTVLPNVYRVRDALKSGLLDEFENGRKITSVDKDGNLKVDEIKGDGIKRDLQADISEIPSLQEDMLRMAQWMAISPHITYNERREMMKFERIDNPLFDEPLIPTGVQTVEDMQMIDPLDIVTEDGN